MKWEGRFFTRTYELDSKQSFCAAILLKINTVRVKTQLVVLTQKKCWLLQAAFRYAHNAAESFVCSPTLSGAPG